MPYVLRRNERGQAPGGLAGLGLNIRVVEILGAAKVSLRAGQVAELVQ